MTRPETVFLAGGFTRVHEGPMTHWLRRALRIGRDGDVVDFLVDGRRRFARGRARMISAAAGSGRFAAWRGARGRGKRLQGRPRTEIVLSCIGELHLISSFCVILSEPPLRAMAC